jgi:sec-independent protein translocase protein TatA
LTVSSDLSQIEEAMPTMGAPELIVIAVIMLIIFGAGKLPDVAKQLGQASRELRSAMSESTDEPKKNA